MYGLATVEKVVQLCWTKNDRQRGQLCAKEGVLVVLRELVRARSLYDGINHKLKPHGWGTYVIMIVRRQYP